MRASKHNKIVELREAGQNMREHAKNGAEAARVHEVLRGDKNHKFESDTDSNVFYHANELLLCKPNCEKAVEFAVVAIENKNCYD